MTKYTHKTKDGRKARIIATDISGEFNCALAAENVSSSHGEVVLVAKFYEDKTLITPLGSVFKEFNKWDEVAVDTPIWVRDEEGHNWVPRHFAKYKYRTVYTWKDGTTSHSSTTLLGGKFRAWNFATLENPNA